MTLKANDRLILENSSLRIKVTALFKELDEKPELAHLFIRNPAKVLASRVLPADFAMISEKSLNRANELIYSIINNPEFVKWIEDYQLEVAGEYTKTGDFPDKKKLRKDFAKAVLKFGDESIVYNLINNSDNAEAIITGGEMRPVADCEVVVETLVALLLVVAVAAVVLPVLFIGKANLPELKNNRMTMVKITSTELHAIANQLVEYAKKR